VAWTLDAAHVAGQTLVTVEPGGLKEFQLHLSLSERMNVVNVFACAYAQRPA
jgi:hypothetical protein